MNKKQINIYNARQIATSNNNVASAIREQNKVEIELKEKEIKSKNRVDISLEEYENMKEQIETLKKDNSLYIDLLSQFRIPNDVKIDPSSFLIESYSDVARLRTIYKIRFEVEGVE